MVTFVYPSNCRFKIARFRSYVPGGNPFITWLVGGLNLQNRGDLNQSSPVCLNFAMFETSQADRIFVGDKNIQLWN